MPLSKLDLQNIEVIIDRKNKDLTGDLTRGLEDIIGRSGSRIIDAMDLLQRDTFLRLEDHEKRIARLEKLENS